MHNHRYRFRCQAGLALAMVLLMCCPDSASSSVAQNRAAVSRWSWPIDRPAVVNTFLVGERNWEPGHRGVDLRGAQTIRSACAGEVFFIGTIAGVEVISITCGALRLTYQPVRASSLTVGAQVQQGQEIGELVATGAHCPGCLHWGAIALTEPRRYIDPLILVGKWDVVLLG